jgi:hypothetical protein
MEIIVMAIVLLTVMTFSGFVVAKQQRTIDTLTDKIMARDYREYKSMTGQAMVEDKPSRKPMSFFDDPNIDEEVAN